MGDRDAEHMLNELQEARAELETLRRFRRAVLLAYDMNGKAGDCPGTEFTLRMILEVNEEYLLKFGPGWKEVVD